MGDLHLSMALERYDRHVPFFMGTVASPPGVCLKPLEVGVVFPCRDGLDRHRRFLRDKEFDVAETSLSSHIIAVSRGEPFVGIPVFPRRLFSQNHIWVNADAGIQTPRDLEGKRVIVTAFQVTMTVLAMGDLKFEYGVAPEAVHWLLTHEEVMPLGPRPGFSVEHLPPGADVGRMLIDGQADAMIVPHPPDAVLQAPAGIRPLFADRRAESLRYYAKVGYYPIMHLIAFQAPVLQAHPELGPAIARMWEDAKQQANQFYRDPGYANLAFAHNELAAQRDAMGSDPWPSGLAANRTNLERFIEYMVDQKLIDAPLPVEALFHSTMLDS